MATTPMKAGYDASGLPVSKSGPHSSPAVGTPDMYSARGVPIIRNTVNNADLGEGSRKTVDGTRAASIARGGW